MTADQTWTLSGEHLENCNCEVFCPCLLPGVVAMFWMLNKGGEPVGSPPLSRCYQCV